MSPAQVDAAVTLLADGPMGDVDLLTALGLAGASATEVLAFLRLLRDDGRVLLLPDGRAVRRDTLLDGLVSWHRLTEAEVSERVVELGDAALVLVAAVGGVDPVVVDGTAVSLRTPLLDDGDPDHDRGPLVDLPEGWRPELAPGDLVGFTSDDGVLALLDAGPQPGPGDPDQAAEAVVAAMRGLVAEHALPVLHLDGDPGTEEDDDPGTDQDDGSGTGQEGGLVARLIADGRWVMELDDVAPLVMLDHGDHLRGLDRPVAEVLDDAGLRVDDGSVRGPGVDDEIWALHSLGRDLILSAFPGHALEPGQAEVAGMAWAALHDPEGRAAPDALADILRDPTVAEAVASRIEAVPDDEVAEVVDRLDGASLHLVGAPGAALVLARALVVLGRVVEAKDVAERCFVGLDEEWVAASEMLALLRAVSGDVEGAVAAYRALGEDGMVDRLVRWRAVPPSGVGRNEPCPCGSGRKFKQCCLARPPRLSLDARVPFLWWKLEVTTVELFGLDLPELSDAHAPGEMGMVAIDALLVEGGALLDVGLLVEGLLPDDERDLLAGWGVPGRGVHEVVVVDREGLGLVDLHSGERARVPADEVSHAHRGDLLLAVVVPGPDDRSHVVGSVVHLAPAVRDRALAGLAGGLDAPGLVALVEELAEAAPDVHLH